VDDMPHYQGHIREQFLELLNIPDFYKDSIIAEKMRGMMGELWKCNDQMPKESREEVAELLEYLSLNGGIDIDEKKIREIKNTCTYAKAARYIKPSLERKYKH
jgi:hypothetical protein